MIGEMFKAQRKKKGITAKELSQKAEISDTYISLLETDKAKNPLFNVIKKIAEALDIQPTELM